MAATWPPGDLWPLHIRVPYVSIFSVIGFVYVSQNEGTPAIGGLVNESSAGNKGEIQLFHVLGGRQIQTAWP